MFRQRLEQPRHFGFGRSLDSIDFPWWSATNDAYYVTHPGVCGDHLVGEEVELQPRLAEDVLAKLYDLEGQHVLAAVVANLEDGCLPNVLARSDLEMKTLTI